MKKIIFLFAFASFVLLAPSAVALAAAQCTDGGFCALAPIVGLTDQSMMNGVIGNASFAAFFNNLYKFLVGIAVALAIIEIIWGGLEISTKDSVSSKSDGKQRIYNAIMGLLLILSPVIVFSIINPNILNLSIKMDPIVSKTVPQAAP